MHNTIVKVFNSVADECRYVIEHCADVVGNNGFSGSNGMSHFGCQSSAEGARYVMQGATVAECATAATLMEKMNSGIQGRTRSEWTPSVCGAYPMVPDVLAGFPDNMRHRQQVESDIAPLKIMIDVGVSGGVTKAQLARRGAACAALVMLLSETRPVEAYAFTTGKYGDRISPTVVIATKLDNNPLTLAQVVAVFASPQFSRAMDYTVGMRVAGIPNGTKLNTIDWGWSIGPSNGSYTAKVKEALELSATDIVIPGGYLTEADQMLADPVAWVEKYLAAQRNTEEA